MLAVEPNLLADDPPIDGWSGLRARIEVAEHHEEASPPPERVDPRLLSSELVLVCPELRAISLSLLPDRDPDGFYPRSRREERLSAQIPIESTAVATPSEPPVAFTDTRTEGFGALAVAGLVRVVGQAMVTVVTGAAIVAGVSGLVILATSLH